MYLSITNQNGEVVEYWLNEYETYKNNLTNPDYARMRELVNKAGSFLEFNKTYMTKGEYNRCLPHFS